MELYVIRHAEAVALGERGVTEDAERPLTKQGQRQAQALGTGLPGVGVQLELVLTSPLVRARQTADGLAKQWKAGTLTVEVNALATNFKSASWPGRSTGSISSIWRSSAMSRT